MPISGMAAEKLGQDCCHETEARAHGRVGSKVRKVGWHQTVTSVIVILKTFKSR